MKGWNVLAKKSQKKENMEWRRKKNEKAMDNSNQGEKVTRMGLS